MKITMTHQAYQKLWYFIRECDQEISGFGKVRDITPVNAAGDPESVQVLEIYDIETFPQEVSGTHATIDDEALALFLTEKVANDEDVSEYRVWWHSHVNMQAFFSAVDTGTIDQSKEFPYLISIVGNKRQEFKTRLDIFQPLRFTQDTTFEVTGQDNEDLLNHVRDEIAQKVSFTRYQPVTPQVKKVVDDRDEELAWLNVDDDVDDLDIPNPHQDRKGNRGRGWGV